MNHKKILVIGGGTGTYTILSGLKKYPLDLSVIVTMMDNGGSNRIIRDEFGLLPTSDLRQCMIALSEEKPKDLLRKLFTYRYSSGVGISGMTFGNLYMAALTDIYGSQELAIEKTCEFLDVKGKILPVTFDSTNLVAVYDNGREVLGEHAIDEPDEESSTHKIVGLYVLPKAKANKKATGELKKVDMIVLGPGDLYTSILPNIVIDGIKEAISTSSAKVVFVLNLMTKYGQTQNFKASDYLKEAEKYLGKNIIDCVIVNSGKFTEKALEWYANTGAKPVEDDLKNLKGIKVVRGDFVDKNIYVKSKADKLTRSLIRHDSDKLAKVVVSLL
jgi:uncharacterized cofD-like protein